MPERVHPLWYSGILPLLFFVSAVGLGLGMVTMESLVSSWLYRRDLEIDLLGKLAKWASWVLGAYFLLLMGDLAASGDLQYIINPTWETWLFIIEITASTLAPIIIFSIWFFVYP